VLPKDEKFQIVIHQFPLFIGQNVLCEMLNNFISTIGTIEIINGENCKKMKENITKR